MRVHMLGNVLGPIFVYATGLISGVDDPRSRAGRPRPRHYAAELEWGLMLNTLRTAITSIRGWRRCPAP